MSAIGATPKHWRSVGVGPVLAVAAVLAAGCQASPVSTAAGHQAALRVLAAKVTITSGNLAFSSGSASPAQSATLVDERPDLGIRVSVADGRLDSVVVAEASGRTVRGALGPRDTT
ncbi:MAG TPA: hypothetical protein VGS19_16745, partial [Streptosporangiaceae bacterium]|nr:hypothetical protein [Streptosporangiaceae bacterium]